MRTTKSRPDIKKPELNMTSMIDVIFLLLIFFIFTANFEPLEKLLPTNLSSLGSIQNNEKIKMSQEIDLGEIQIKISSADNRLVWFVNQRKCISFGDVKSILRDLKNIDPNIPVIIDPDRNIAMDNVLNVYDVCRINGLTNIQFAASPDALAQGK